ncbi:MAG: response regulator [Anaerolineae bacterium]|nr:response regulator [Anaerolineae bacterium]
MLIVEDDSDTQDMLSILLKEWHAEVRAVQSADEAFELLNLWIPDVLLSDIGLPNEDGYQMIKKIRKLPQSAGGRIPAIAFTACARFDDRMRAISEGFNMYLPKPIEPAELAAAIYSLTRLAQNS